MTTRKLCAIFDSYCIWHGLKKEQQQIPISQLMGL